ncbi:hypothetical protein ACLE20_06895 [Rhizobium sp. YIM 134829]|uniref:hypothetical protein n=1 Tax=Rhizobium sp. YIM 134829 TaxID=3390453 RepID=UPI00397B564B
MKALLNHSTALAIVFASLVYAWINHYEIRIENSIQVQDRWTGSFYRCSLQACRQLYPPSPQASDAE